ncbi:hypothetical protein HZS_2289 [Henneguya salminicola]|nr:hypothetical protein HZS_2289 [Henneguya salminicola]
MICREKKNKSKKDRPRQICIGSFEDIENSINVIAKNENSIPASFVFSHPHSCLAHIFENKIELYFIEKLLNPLKIYLKCPASCVAFHPTDLVVACGCMDGSIVLWNISPSIIRLKKLHWHSNPVGDICFSVDGRYLFSGGAETVLVEWNIENSERNFVPRLGNEIIFIILTGQFLFLVHGNNEITLLDSSNLSIINRLLNFQRGVMPNIGMKYEYESDLLVIGSRMGTISFYSPSIGSTVYSLEVLVKTWRLDNDIKIFKFHSTVESPHNRHINSFEILLNSEDLDILFTSSRDCSTKIWAPKVTMNHKNVPRYIWECVKQIFYQNTPHLLCFSPDYNIFACSTKNFSCFYQFPSFDLYHQIPISHIVYTHFGPKEKSHLFLIASQRHISIYDLNLQKFVVQKSVDNFLVILEPETANICVLLKGKKSKLTLNVYSFDSFDLLQTISFPCDGRALGATFGGPFITPPKNLPLKFCLYVMSVKQDIFVVSEEETMLCNFNAAISQSKILNNHCFDTEVNHTLNIEDKNVLENYKTIISERRFMEKLRSTPSHLLPSPDFMNIHLLNELLASNSINKAEDADSHAHANTLLKIHPSNDIKSISVPKKIQLPILIEYDFNTTLKQTTLNLKFDKTKNLLVC